HFEKVTEVGGRGRKTPRNYCNYCGLMGVDLRDVHASRKGFWENICWYQKTLKAKIHDHFNTMSMLGIGHWQNSNSLKRILYLNFDVQLSV
ncbi:13260_t:CDS:2, partial [Rhizophagus irregularis]